MVADTRAAPGPDRLRPLEGAPTQRPAVAKRQPAGHTLRPLNLPRSLSVKEEAGKPLAVAMSGALLAVEEVREQWRIDDEWWRRPLSRLYYELLLESGDVVTVFQDLVSGEWFQQQY